MVVQVVSAEHWTSIVRDPITSKQIASRLYELHSIVDTFPPGRHEALEVWTTIDKWYRLLTDTNMLSVLTHKHPELKHKINLTQLRNQIELAKIITHRRKTPVVFAHNDTQYGNILRLKDSNELVVIDFEYAGYNPRGYDIANHFCEWMYDYHSQQPAHMTITDYPTKKQQLRFLESYISQSDLVISAEELMKEVELWKMVCHLFWGLWGVIQASQSEIDFDYAYYCTQRLDAFQQDLNSQINKVN